jgi:lysozyme
MDLTKLVAELTRDEGKKLTAYQDTLGNWTIGVGHLLGPRPRMTEITEAECTALLASDITEARDRVKRYFPSLGAAIENAFFYTPNEKLFVRYRALVNMAFNLGDRLGGFVKFAAAVRDENWDEAAFQMMDSKWATQVGARALRLKQMIQTGEDA